MSCLQCARRVRTAHSMNDIRAAIYSTALALYINPHTQHAITMTSLTTQIRHFNPFSHLDFTFFFSFLFSLRAYEDSFKHKLYAQQSTRLWLIDRAVYCVLMFFYPCDGCAVLSISVRVTRADGEDCLGNRSCRSEQTDHVQQHRRLLRPHDVITLFCNLTNRRWRYDAKRRERLTPIARERRQFIRKIWKRDFRFVSRCPATSYVDRRR